MQNSAGDSEAPNHRNAAVAGIDLSSWVGWACYLFGFAWALERSQSMEAELHGGGLGLYVLGIAIVAFLGTVALIQRHMRLSLRANTFGAPVRLVTDGIFHHTRNPIYVAFLLPLLSLGYFSPSAVIAATALYVPAMNLMVIRHEEKVLGARFGEDYAAYKRAVPRWLI